MTGPDALGYADGMCTRTLDDCANVGGGGPIDGELYACVLISLFKTDSSSSERSTLSL